MIWQVTVKEKDGLFDAVGFGIKKDIQDLGIKDVEDVCFNQVYFLEGDINYKQVKYICDNLLVDNISQEYTYTNVLGLTKQKHIKINNYKAIEIAYNPGVMDPVEESTLKGIYDLGIDKIREVKTAKRFLIKGDITDRQLKVITEKILCNKLIQHVVDYSRAELKVQGIKYNFKLQTVELLQAKDDELLDISEKGQLFLNLKEMQAIQGYFKRLKRNPTDCELETIAQTWSEHCGHKTFRGKIEYKEEIQPAFAKASAGCPTSPRLCRTKIKKINNLLKSTIMKVTEELNKPWCVSVFKDNSGVIEFDDKYNVCFKVETHNHPSALEPYGGANTGIGGVIRDPLGTGLGAKPILNTDVFCFGPLNYPFSKLPKGTLHPKRIMKGVVSGVRDYGNRMGIPTANGAILFDEGFVGNPLVYCGTVGIMPRDKSFKEVMPQDLIVLLGGKTGRDGIHGATFSSGELTSESERISSGAVQIGNPIQEKKMVDAILKARDQNLYNAITDCGGGGLSSAVGEMGRDIGAQVDLEKVPLKYEGLSYTEIWISESQERMVLAVPKKNIDKLMEIFQAENVEATVIGEFTNDRHLKLFYEGNLVCDLDMDFLHTGLPQVTKKAVWISKGEAEPKIKCPKDLTNTLKKILSSLNVCSKEWVVRQYDHEVQAGSVLKPLVGKDCDGPSDACVIRPCFDSQKGLIISCGINFQYSKIDPYWMAASVIDEALRQIIAVGGSLDRVALLDNFCWGNPDKPDRLGGLVRSATSCYKIAKEFGTPFISGKDSLNNEYKVDNKSIPIPGTLLISALSIIEDINKVISMDIKAPGNLIYIVGKTFDELGGSEYYKLFGKLGRSVPQLDAKKSKTLMDKLSQAINQGLVLSCHDCSEGGIAVALAEMAFSGGYGMEVFLGEVPFTPTPILPVGRQESLVWGFTIKNKITKQAQNDIILFSESNTRFVVEVKKENQKEFEDSIKGLPFGLIGCVSDGKLFRVYGLDGKVCLKANINELKEDWQKPLYKILH